MYSRCVPLRVIPGRVVRFKSVKPGVANRLATTFRKVLLCRSRSAVALSTATLHTYAHRHTQTLFCTSTGKKNKTHNEPQGAPMLSRRWSPADTGGGGRWRWVGGVGEVAAESHGSVGNESVIHSIAHKLGETSVSASTWKRRPNGTREVDITMTGINECGWVNGTRFNHLHLHHPASPPTSTAATTSVESLHLRCLKLKGWRVKK